MRPRHPRPKSTNFGAKFIANFAASYAINCAADCTTNCATNLASNYTANSATNNASTSATNSANIASNLATKINTANIIITANRHAKASEMPVSKRRKRMKDVNGFLLHTILISICLLRSTSGGFFFMFSSSAF